MILDHIAINVSNIEDSVSWYKEKLKAKVLYQDNTGGMVEAGGTKIAFTVASEHPPHISLQVKSLKEFPDGCETNTHRDGSVYFYDPDPDGNIIEWIYYPDSLN